MELCHFPWRCSLFRTTDQPRGREFPPRPNSPLGDESVKQNASSRVFTIFVKKPQGDIMTCMMPLMICWFCCWKGESTIMFDWFSCCVKNKWPFIMRTSHIVEIFYHVSTITLHSDWCFDTFASPNIAPNAGFCSIIQFGFTFLINCAFQNGFKPMALERFISFCCSDDYNFSQTLAVEGGSSCFPQQREGWQAVWRPAVKPLREL